MIAGLVNQGLATVTPSKVRASGKVIEVAKVRITAAGRRSPTTVDVYPWAVLRIESSQSKARRKKFLQSIGSITDFTLAPLVALSAFHETRVDRRRRLRGRRWLYDDDRD